jgi:hypothetical protein
MLGELVEAKDARVRGAVVDDCRLGAHALDLIVAP